MRFFFFFFFQFKLVTKLQFNCVHITNLPRLAFEFFFVEFPSVADGKTEKKTLQKERQAFKINLYIYIYLFIYSLTFCRLRNLFSNQSSEVIEVNNGF